MSTFLRIFASLVLVSFSVSAQQTTFQDPLLDHLIGKWVLQGTIDGTETSHDIVSEWVLGHHYVRLHEVSREKNAKGQAAYEAIVFIGWDQPSSEYACLWLDTTGGGGISPQVIGHAKRGGDEIAFLFKYKDGGSFHTTFAYNKSTDTWQWFMDGEEGGKRQPFARVKLTKQSSRRPSVREAGQSADRYSRGEGPHSARFIALDKGLGPATSPFRDGTYEFRA